MKKWANGAWGDNQIERRKGWGGRGAVNKVNAKKFIDQRSERDTL